LVSINEQKVENLFYEEIVKILQHTKAPFTLTFRENPELETEWTKAEEHREKGNEYYSEDKIDKAIEECSKAISLHQTNKIYYSNRILMYLKKK